MTFDEVVFVPTNQEGVFAIIDREDADQILSYRWHVNSRGYVVRHRRSSDPPGAQWVRMHREICPTPGDHQIDHINRNKLDNRRSNLRPATRRENKGNIGLLRTNTSGFRGVSWRSDTGMWLACIWIHGRNRHIGRFTIKEDAARAYDQAAKVYFGEFAYLNFPELEAAA
jgi:hypothetical protein